jgi:hypothetical protein
MPRDEDVTRKTFIGTSAATAAGVGLLGVAAADASAGERDRRRSLRKRRERQVLEHMDSENRQEFDDTLETFEHPRYEIIPTGDVYDGAQEVAEYYRSTRTTFPDQRNENVVLYHRTPTTRSSWSSTCSARCWASCAASRRRGAASACA